MFKDKSFYWVLAFSAVIFWSRMIPHQANFSPVLALCLLAGYVGRGQLWSLLLPATALLASDWFLNFYPGWALNYVALVSLVVGGRFMSARFGSTILTGIFGATFFFVVSNLGVWLYSEMYSLDWNGFVTCFTLALLFVRATFVSTLTCLLAFSSLHFLWQKASQKGYLERL